MATLFLSQIKNQFDTLVGIVIRNLYQQKLQMLFLKILGKTLIQNI